MSETACQLNTANNTSQTFQRWRITLVFIAALLFLFWGYSRYPDLLAEYTRAESHSFLDRDIGVLSKDAMLATHNITGPFEKFWRATVDWLDTNKIGMTFGFLFSAAILLLLEQSASLRKRATKNGWQGILSGLLLGWPLGICANCATPVALGLNKSGVSNDASFSTLITSPSLNPIGLLIIFMLFPFEVGLIRIGVIVGFLFLILPLLTRTFHVVKAPLFNVATPVMKAKATETWQQSFKYCLKRYRHYLFYIFKQVMPAMIIIGLLASILLVLLPLQNFLLLQSVSIFDLIGAAFIGIILPMPMFVDVVLVSMLYQMGLPLSVSVTLLLSMAPTSAFAMYVMGRHISWRLSLSIGFCLGVLAVAAGFLVQQYQEQHGLVNVSSTESKPFSVVKTVRSKKPFDFADFKSFFGSGVSIIDFNHDGLSDILLAGNHGMRLYKNTGKMQFKEVSNNSGINNSLDSMAGIWGDYDNDGLIDLYLVNYIDSNGKPQSNRLYKNIGNGKFTDVTAKLNLIDNDLSSSAAWADYDNDGDLDLFVANYGKIWINDKKSIHGQSQTDRLYRNDGNKFVDVTVKAKVGGISHKTQQLLKIDHNQIAANRGFTFQPVWFDYNNDNLPDLFVTQDFGTSQLYKNNGDGAFSNVTNKMGLAVYGTSMGVSVSDVNQDGFWDLLVTTGNKNQLWLNQNGRSFTNKIEQFKMADQQRFGWGVAPIDFKNNAKPAYFIVNGVTAKGANTNNFQKLMAKVNGENQFYIDKPLTGFKNMDKKYNLYNDMVGRGLAIGDLNNDGKLDLVISNRDNQAQMVVYKNNGANKNHSLKIKLEGGRDINRMAVGSRVSVYIKDKVQHKLLTAGSSFLSQHSPILHFGLGKAIKADKVVITWPNGKQKVLLNVKADDLLKIKY